MVGLDKYVGPIWAYSIEVWAVSLKWTVGSYGLL
jgi:hypothetical protein